MIRTSTIKAIAILLTLAGDTQTASKTQAQTPPFELPKSAETVATGRLPRLDQAVTEAFTPKDIYHMLVPRRRELHPRPEKHWRRHLRV